MKTRNFLLAGLAALSLAAVGANAQIAAATNGDLILSFTKIGSTSANDLLIDLGSFTQFNAGTSIASVSNFSVSDVTATYGSVAGLGWSVIGATGNGNGLSKPDGSLWLTALAKPNTGSYAQQNGTSNNIDAWVQNSLPGFASNVSGLTANATALGQTDGFTGLALYSINGQSITSSASATGTSTFELYQSVPGAVTDLGTFSLNLSAGTLSFTTAAVAVPEPSTYAAFLGLATLGIVLYRRRQQVAVEV
jgi:hypothetical protein